MNKAALIAKLPPEKGEEEVITRRQNVDDIIGEVLEAHSVFARDYDRIAPEFAGGSVEKKLYDFCRNNLAYDVETEEDQTTKSPTVLLKDGHCDCKGYAGFIAGVLDGLNRSGQGRFSWCYRFAEYEGDDDDPGHVFVVVRQREGGEIWIDPVLSQFNKRTPAPTSWVDKTPSQMLTRLSGVGAPVGNPPGGGRPDRPAVNGCGCGPLSGYQMGTVPPQGVTPMQLGIPVMQAVFQHWGSEYPAAPAILAVNPPVRFFDGANQLVLPDPVTAGGQPVPPLPANIRLVWDSSFMGMPIPGDMINVTNMNGALVLSPVLINSVGSTWTATYNFLYNTNRYCLFLLIAALENLIYSYSSYPWGNQYNDLSQQIDNVISLQSVYKNYNFLVYPGANKKTFGGQILQGFATVQRVAAPIEALIIPGAGLAIAAGTAALEAGEAASNKNQQVTTYTNTPEVVVATPSTSLLPGSLTLPDLTTAISTFAQANPVATIGIAAAVGLLLYELFND